MPVSRRTAEALARSVADSFADAQTRMLEHLARVVGADIHQPHWAELKAAQLGAYEVQMRALIADLQREAATGVHTALTDAYSRGGLAAVADLKQLGTVGVHPVEPLAQMRAVEALAQATTGYLEATGTRILTSTLEAYRKAVAAGEEARAIATTKGVMGVTLGVQTRIQATQGVLDDFAQSGVTGFIDAANRAWSLDSYAEMAVRAGTMNAAVEGHLDTLQENDQDLVIVSEDGSPCPECEPYEGEVLSISGDSEGYDTVDDAEAAGLMHPGCFAPGTVVSGPAVCAADTRWYEGELVVLRVAAGDQLSVTENHPILTPHGWVPAGQLNEGDDVVCYLGQERMHGVVGPDYEEMPALIEEIPGALLNAVGMSSVSVPSSPKQFHGDGGGGEVDVVYADSLLMRGHESAVAEPIAQGNFAAIHLPEALDGGSPLGAFLPSSRSASRRSVGGSSPGATLSERPAGLLTMLLVGTRDDRVAAKNEATGDCRLTEAERFSNLFLGPFSRDVSLSRLVEVRRRHFLGHVYNLQTVGGWYAANGIIAHNCLHQLSCYQEGVTVPYEPKSDEEAAQQAQDYRDNQRQRAIERDIRAAKRTEAVALTPEAQAEAHAKVLAGQARARANVAETNAVRQSAREQISRAAGRAT